MAWKCRNQVSDTPYILNSIGQKVKRASTEQRKQVLALEKVRGNGPRPHPPLPILTTNYDRRGGIRGEREEGMGDQRRMLGRVSKLRFHAGQRQRC